LQMLARMERRWENYLSNTRGQAADVSQLHICIKSPETCSRFESNGGGRLSFVPLMSAGIDLKRSMVIAHRCNLSKVSRKEAADRPSRLVLMDAAQLMRNQPIADIVIADKDGMSERDAAYIWS
jgi:hypothetical protein